MLMSPSALPLYNMDKLIYKSGFFNKFKETLPIVSWFLRKEETGDKRLPGSGRLDKHRGCSSGAGMEGSLWFQEVEQIQLMAQGLAGQEPVQAKNAARVRRDVIYLVSRDQKWRFVLLGGPVVILCCPILAVQGKLTSSDPGEARGV